MTEKEIYKARSEGLEFISNMKSYSSDSEFLEFMSFVREITEKYDVDLNTPTEALTEKCKIRKELNRIFENNYIRRNLKKY